MGEYMAKEHVNIIMFAAIGVNTHYTYHETIWPLSIHFVNYVHLSLVRFFSLYRFKGKCSRNPCNSWWTPWFLVDIPFNQSSKTSEITQLVLLILSHKVTNCSLPKTHLNSICLKEMEVYHTHSFICFIVSFPSGQHILIYFLLWLKMVKTRPLPLPFRWVAINLFLLLFWGV